MRSPLRTILLMTAVLGMIMPRLLAQKTQVDPDVQLHLQNLPFPAPVITVPVFPDVVVDIRSHGAVADGQTMNTIAFRDAFKECVNKGGGRVLVPAGLWLTGPIAFSSNVDLHLERGAMIVFSPRFEDYPLAPRPNEKSGRLRSTPPIFGYKLENVAITGEGIIDGSGSAWRPVKKEKMTARQWKELLDSGGAVSADGKIWYPSVGAMNGADIIAAAMKKKGATADDYAPAREFLRSAMVEFVQCRNILIDGPTFQNSPAWNLHPTQCENVVIRHTTVLNPWWGQNTDGIDIASCRNVLIAHCLVDVGDDAICIKPGVPADKTAPACENIIIDDCTVYHGHGGLVIGSESYGGARHIIGRNLTFSGTDVGLRFKSARDRGGIVERVFVDGVRMVDIANDAILFDMFYGDNAERTDVSAVGKKENVRERIPHFRTFELQHIVCRGAKRAATVRGLEDAPVEDLVLKHMTLSADEGIRLRDASGIQFDSVTVLAERGAAFVIDNARNIDIRSPGVRVGADAVVAVTGVQSHGIRIQHAELGSAKEGVRIGKEVPAGAVEVSEQRR